MRRMTLLAALLALLCAGAAPLEAQCNGCGIGYWYAGVPLTGGTMTGPLLLPDGAAATPSWAFASQPDLGFYRNLANRMRVGSGTAVLELATVYPISTDASVLGAANLYWQSLALSRGIHGGKTKALTDAAAATAFVTVAVPTNGWAAGELIWAATSLSGSDQLTTTGSIRFAGAATNVTPVCTVNVIGTDLAAVSGGANTLVCTWTNVVAGQTCALSVTCTNNLAGTQAITMNGRTDMTISNTLVFP